MTRRTKAQWCDLVEQQKVSGLTAAEFCRRNEINAKYFSVRKQNLKESPGNFIRVAAPVARAAPVTTNGIKIRVVELEIPCEAIGETLVILMDRLDR